LISLYPRRTAGSCKPHSDIPPMLKTFPAAVYQSLGDTYSALYDLTSPWFPKFNLDDTWRHGRRYLEKVPAKVYSATGNSVDHQTAVVYLIFSAVLVFITVSILGHNYRGRIYILARLQFFLYLREAREYLCLSEMLLECEKAQVPASTDKVGLFTRFTERRC
jgi:hypothetical protein